MQERQTATHRRRLHRFTSAHSCRPEPTTQLPVHGSAGPRAVRPSTSRVPGRVGRFSHERPSSGGSVGIPPTFGERRAMLTPTHPHAGDTHDQHTPSGTAAAKAVAPGAAHPPHEHPARPATERPKTAPVNRTDPRQTPYRADPAPPHHTDHETPHAGPSHATPHTHTVDVKPALHRRILTFLNAAILPSDLEFAKPLFIHDHEGLPIGGTRTATRRPGASASSTPPSPAGSWR